MMFSITAFKCFIFGNKIISYLIIILLLMLLGTGLTHLSAIEEWLGIETKNSLKIKTIEQSAIIDTITKVNSDNIKDATNLANSKEVDVKAVEAVTSKNTLITAKLDTINKDRIYNIKKINDFNNLKVITEEEAIRAISQAQIESVWSAYCNISVNNKECKL